MEGPWVRAFQSWLAPGQEGDSGNWGDISQAGQLPQQAQQTSPRKPCPLRTCCRLTTSSARGAPGGLPVKLLLSYVPAQDPRRPSPQDPASLMPTHFRDLPGSGTALCTREKKHAGRGPGLGTSKDVFPSGGPLSGYLPHSFIREPALQQPSRGLPDLQHGYKHLLSALLGAAQETAPRPQNSRNHQCSCPRKISACPPSPLGDPLSSVSPPQPGESDKYWNREQQRSRGEPAGPVGKAIRSGGLGAEGQDPPGPRLSSTTPPSSQAAHVEK